MLAILYSFTIITSTATLSIATIFTRLAIKTTNTIYTTTPALVTKLTIYTCPTFCTTYAVVTTYITFVLLFVVWIFVRKFFRYSVKFSIFTVYEVVVSCEYFCFSLNCCWHNVYFIISSGLTCSHSDSVMVYPQCEHSWM